MDMEEENTGLEEQNHNSKQPSTVRPEQEISSSMVVNSSHNLITRTEWGEIDTTAPFESVKAAVTLFGEGVFGDKADGKKLKLPVVERRIAKETELHQMQKELDKSKEQLKNAEATKVQTLLELEKVKRVVKDLTQKLETAKDLKEKASEVTKIAMLRAEELEPANTNTSEDNNTGQQEELYAIRDKHITIITELDAAKQELRRVKQELAASLEAKTLATKQAENAMIKVEANSTRVDELSKEIAASNESLVLVKLACIEAVKEHGNILAEKEAKNQKDAAVVEKTSKELEALRKGLDAAKDLERKLSTTVVAVEHVQKEMILAKESQSKVAEAASKAHDKLNKVKLEIEEIKNVTSVKSTSVESLSVELGEAKENMQRAIKEDSALRVAMDSVRNELEQIRKELAETTQKVADAEAAAADLNVELHKCRSTLAAAATSEAKAKEATSDLEVALQQLTAETENARKELGSDFLDRSELVDDFSHSSDNNDSEQMQFYVGLKGRIDDLKGHLFHSQVSVVGVHCMGGGGKTALAFALSNDLQVKDYFQNNVIFVRVSQSPDLKQILETIWEKIAGRERPEFKDVENARTELQQLILDQSKPSLIILDDVWCKRDLEKLLIEGYGCKTLITTRDKSTIPTNRSTQLYQLPLLGPKDAFSLFCFWATGQTSISSDTDANAMQEVQGKCGGLPLALKVIGSSLHGELKEAWKNKLSRGEYISDYHKKGLFRSLQTSIDSLVDVTKECLLDLAIFPKDRKICVDALLDIWFYVRKVQRSDAFAILSELSNKNLLRFTSKSRGSTKISYENASELYISQHNVMRDLVSYLAHKDDAVHSKRLVITRMESGLLSEGELINDSALDTQILSVFTEPPEENQWPDIDFPEAEALMLLFTSREYSLPPFLKSMKKLKVLMVFNCCSKKATVKGVDILSSLPELKSIRLDRLISPLVEKQSIEELQSLEKISVSLCEGFGNISTFDTTKLQHFNLDHSSDLEKLPIEMCKLPSALSWSITNCHLLQNLPYDLGNMKYLRILRLSALPGLKELPVSIGKLEHLEYLDISVCERLKQLPKEIGQLKKLREFDMRECSRLRRLPTTVCELSSLNLVLCDEKIGKQWMRAKNISIPELTVEIVEARFSLDWLDD